VLSALALVTFFACNGAAPSSSPASIPTAATPVSRIAPSLAGIASEQGGRALSVDERGVPVFVVATTKSPSAGELTADPERAARFHLSRFLPALGVDASALAVAKTVGVRAIDRGSLVHLRQRIDGLDVYPGDVKVLLAK